MVGKTISHYEITEKLGEGGKPILRDGYVTVPDKPGLGVELNKEVIKEHLRYPGYLEPTPEYDKYITTPWMTYPGPWPHLDENGKMVNTAVEQ